MASLGEDLLGIVNKLQDLVFNTIGNDSLDLPQIVYPHLIQTSQTFANRPLGRRWFAVIGEVLRPRKHSWQRFPSPGQWYRYSKAAHPPAHQHPH